MNTQDEALSVTRADYEMAEQYRDRHGLNGLNRDHLADLIAHVRLSHSTPGDAEVRKALKNARDALLTVGNDYPGSSCQQWCTDKAQEAWNVLEPWRHCPSTHCERTQECRSVNECSAERSTLATPSGRAQGEVELRKAAEEVEQWWLNQGMKAFDGAPACIFNLRQALATPSGRAQGEVERLTALLAERNARTDRLLAQRDKFIVDNGLWQAFVDTLPAAPPAQDQTKGVDRD